MQGAAVFLPGNCMQVGCYQDLKAFLIRFSALSAGAIPRSALHMAVAGKAPRQQGEVLGPWVPSPGMICAATRLPADGLPGKEVELFVQQAELAVRPFPTHPVCAALKAF